MAFAPRIWTRIFSLGCAGCILAGCAAVRIPASRTMLNDDQVRNLVLHPQRWFGRTVTLQIYPYDFGSASPQSYRICFEPCDEERANRSVAILDTRPDRFKGYRGDRPAVVTARFGSNCAHIPDPSRRRRNVEICPDLISHRFIEAN